MTVRAMLDEFHSARDNVMWGVDWSRSRYPYSVKEWAGIDHTNLESQFVELSNLARQIIIARDFGEFDAGRALMLWKLQR